MCKKQFGAAILVLLLLTSNSATAQSSAPLADAAEKMDRATEFVAFQPADDRRRGSILEPQSHPMCAQFCLAIDGGNRQLAGVV